MDPNINLETGETTSTGPSPRFSMWIALTVLSVIVLGASVEVVRCMNRLYVAFDLHVLLLDQSRERTCRVYDSEGVLQCSLPLNSLVSRMKLTTLFL